MSLFPEILIIFIPLVFYICLNTYENNKIEFKKGYRDFPDDKLYKKSKELERIAKLNKEMYLKSNIRYYIKGWEKAKSKNNKIKFKNKEKEILIELNV